MNYATKHLTAIGYVFVILLGIISLCSGNLIVVIEDLYLFVVGKYQEMHKMSTTHVWLAVVATIPFLSISFSTIMYSFGLIKKSSSYEVDETIKNDPFLVVFPVFIVINILEEIIARWLFLGVIAKVTALSDNLGFYLLFLAGNTMWTLIHLLNHKDKADRKLMRLVPIFFIGVLLTCVYVRYGLWITIISHITINFYVLSYKYIKKYGQSINKVELT